MKLQRDDIVLLVVDIQERLAFVMEHRAQVTARAALLIEAAKLMGIPVVTTEQYPRGLGPTVAEIREALPPGAPVEKLSFSCCGEPSFLEALEATGRRKVVLAGMETHICVFQTTLDLLSAGYGVHIPRDAVCSRRKLDWKTGLDLAREAGAVVTSAETVLFQLLGRAGTEEFKKISKMVK
ncbi:MAG: hydrolase [Nitrospirota bacterium]|jgi:nicotinamidase-related amidase